MEAEVSLWNEILKQSPVVAVVGFFAWTLLRIVTSVLMHYQEMHSGIMGKILSQLDVIAERTRKCEGRNDGRE